MMEAVAYEIPDRVKWRREVEELKNNPGMWYRITTRPNIEAAASFVQAIKDGRKRAFRPLGAFECRSHGREVLVRYVTEEK